MISSLPNLVEGPHIAAGRRFLTPRLSGAKISTRSRNTRGTTLQFLANKPVDVHAHVFFSGQTVRYLQLAMLLAISET
jgi:hypothetical protein